MIILKFAHAKFTRTPSFEFTTRPKLIFILLLITYLYSQSGLHSSSHSHSYKLIVISIPTLILSSWLQTIREMSRDEKNMRMRNACTSYFVFLCCFARQISRASNCLTVEAVIMHETKGFSRAIRDKMIEQNVCR